MRVTIKDAAERLGLPEQTLRIWIRNGCPFGEVICDKKCKRRTYYINGERLNNYLQGGNQNE